MKNFNIVGRVINRETRQGIAGLKVEAWDKDLILDDLLGTAVTDEQGSFQIDFSESSFRDLIFLERKPDVFFKLFLADELIESTEKSVLWNVGAGKKEIIIEALDRSTPISSLKLQINFDEQPEKELDVALYAFETGGRFLSKWSIKEGQTSLSIPEASVNRLRLFVAPQELRQNKATPTLMDMERFHAYEPTWRFNPELPIQQLLPIPIVFWKFWLFCFCPVHGRVVKTEKIGGVSVDCPVPAARVHICEVDPLIFFIRKLPDADVFKLRDELLIVLERPPLPIPDPEPDPYSLQFPLQQVALSPQPEPPSIQLPLSTRAAFSSASVELVRSELIANINLIQPFLCRWPWFWPWLRYDEVAVVETNMQGHFDYLMIYACAGDKPDLYFWVEYQIGGVWTTVYRPSIRCHTYWNYVCGSEITIRVSDPRVFGAKPENNLAGLKVCIERIGSIYTNRIGSNGTLSPAAIPLGLTDIMPVGPTSTAMNCAFGGTLIPHLEFNAEALKNAGITHYRWSYQRLDENGMLGDDEKKHGVWYYIDAPVSHIYNEVYSNKFTVKSFDLGPDHAGLFKIPPSTPPKINPDDLNDYVWWSSHRLNEASAYLNTNIIAKLAGETQTHGYLGLKLELFRINDGTDVAEQVVNLSRDTFVVPPPVEDFNSGDYTAVQAPDTSVELADDGTVSAFFMRVYVDNRPTEAVIQETQVNTNAAGACGMIPYQNGDDAVLSFKAYQPGNFAVFIFNVYKGSSGLVDIASDQAKVTGSNGIYDFPDTSHLFKKSFDASTLVKHKTPICTSAAFSENLYVYAAVLDGYDWQYNLNSSDFKAFALTLEK